MDERVDERTLAVLARPSFHLTKRRSKYMLDGATLQQLRLNPWSHNRPVDMDRAEQLAAFQRKEYLVCKEYSFDVLPVSVAFWENALYVVDGQHRLQAWKMLGFPEVAKWDVNVHLCEREADVQQVFENVNSSTPVPANYYSEKVSQVLNAFLERLMSEYPDAHREGKVAKPRFAPQTVREALGSYPDLREYIQRGQITAADLMRAAQHQNNIKRHEYKHRAAPRTYKMAEKIKFFLALENPKTWPTTVAAEAITFVTAAES